MKQEVSLPEVSGLSNFLGVGPFFVSSHFAAWSPFWGGLDNFGVGPSQNQSKDLFVANPLDRKGWFVASRIRGLGQGQSKKSKLPWAKS